MSEPGQKVLIRLTATIYRGKKKVKTETAMLHLTQDASVCVKGALHVLAAALKAENNKTNPHHD